MLLRRLIAMLFFVALQACVTGPVEAPAPRAASEIRDAVTILVSIDGFRPDYLDRGITPRLSALAAQGVRGAMRSSFPSNTFPNHYTLVTGLRPDRHGVVGNRMEDAARPGETFTMATADPFWWTQAEPIWITAEKAGVRTATMFWPGANVDFGGKRPQNWHAFDQNVNNAQRVDGIIDWLRRPAATRPRFMTLYFDTIDTAGHTAGPDGAALGIALGELDATIGSLVDQLAELHQPANLVIVADHGMAATSSERMIRVDEMLAADSFRAVALGGYAGIEPVAGQTAAVESALLKPHPNMQCWRKSEMPARFGYGTHPRVPAIVCLAETGWLITDRAPKEPFMGGGHGYDQAAPEMAALFLAHGPDFAAGRTVALFDNTDVHPLVADLIGLAVPRSDGKLATFAGVRR